LPSVKTNNLNNDGIEAISKDTPHMEAQIKDVLMKDDDLQIDTIDYLMSNPEAAQSLTSMVKKNKESNEKL